MKKANKFVYEQKTPSFNLFDNNNLCPDCGRNLSSGMIFTGIKENGQINFPYLKVGESIHIECYIKRTIRKTLDKELQHIKK